MNKVTLNTPQPRLAAQLRRLRPGELSSPFFVAEWLLLVQMISCRPAQLDEKIENILLDQALESFLQFGSERLAIELTENKASNSTYHATSS